MDGNAGPGKTGPRGQGRPIGGRPRRSTTTGGRVRRSTMTVRGARLGLAAVRMRSGIRSETGRAGLRPWRQRPRARAPPPAAGRSGRRRSPPAARCRRRGPGPRRRPPGWSAARAAHGSAGDPGRISRASSRRDSLRASPDHTRDPAVCAVHTFAGEPRVRRMRGGVIDFRSAADGRPRTGLHGREASCRRIGQIRASKCRGSCGNRPARLRCGRRAPIVGARMGGAMADSLFDLSDPRLVPARPEIADVRLRGHVAADATSWARRARSSCPRLPCAGRRASMPASKPRR